MTEAVLAPTWPGVRGPGKDYTLWERWVHPMVTPETSVIYKEEEKVKGSQ